MLLHSLSILVSSKFITNNIELESEFPRLKIEWHGNLHLQPVMPRSSASRRTQFSSCDACHRSRVACDASKMGHQPGHARSGGSCSRCLLKKRDCTFKVKIPHPVVTSCCLRRLHTIAANCLQVDQNASGAITDRFGFRLSLKHSRILWLL